MFAGIVVFSILGHRAHVTNIPITEVGGGAGLAFITFCDAFLQMPVPPLWSVLFFIMLILLGIDSEFGTFEGLIAPFYDMKWVTMRKELFTALVAGGMCLIGFAVISSPGYYVFQMFDDYSVSLPLLLITFFQTISVSWIYGNDRFADDIQFMTGQRPMFFWMVCWKYVSPLAIIIIFFASVVKMASSDATYTAYVGCIQAPFSELVEGAKKSTADMLYPGWAQFFLVVFVLVSMVPIFVFLVRDSVKYPEDWVEGFRKKLTNRVEYYPDPSYADSSRRRTDAEMEAAIIKEMERDRGIK